METIQGRKLLKDGNYLCKYGEYIFSAVISKTIRAA